MRTPLQLLKDQLTDFIQEHNKFTFDNYGLKYKRRELRIKQYKTAIKKLSNK